MKLTVYDISGKEVGSIDVYWSGGRILYLYEAEFPSDAAAEAFEPPEFVGAEITGVARFSGAALALELP